MRLPGLILLLLLPAAAWAQDHAAIARAAYDRQILPGFQRLRDATATLATTAQAHCAPDGPALRAAYQDAFDAWMGVQHLRFGPTEVKDRGFALAFWPDTKGRTPAGLNALLAKQDPAATTPDGIAAQSIAVRGFFALDYLLYDPAAAGAASPYGCQLIGAIAGDIAGIAAALADDWAGAYGQSFLTAGAPGNPVYQAPKEATAALFTALGAALEADADQRLGRPMGSFDAPTPLRAEARRSGRPQRNLVLSLEAMNQLIAILAVELSPADAGHVAAATDRALKLAQGLNDPLFDGVVTPSGRLHLEADQQAVKAVRQALLQWVGPSLGVSPGFNEQDGDGG